MKAKKEREMQNIADNVEVAPMPEDAPPETDEVIIDNFEG